MHRKRIRFTLLVILTLGVIASYLMINTYRNWQFAWALRSKKIFAFLLVSLATSSATISFQTITQNQFLTPYCFRIGFIVCIGTDNSLLFLWWSDDAATGRNRDVFTEYWIDGGVESALFSFLLKRSDECLSSFNDRDDLRYLV